MFQGEVGISRLEIGDLCLACTRCGWDCAASVGAEGGGVGGSSGGLSVHVGVGCGRVNCFHVGGDRLGWQLVVSGELFEDQVLLYTAYCIVLLHIILHYCAYCCNIP